MLNSGFGSQHLQDAVFDPFPMLIGSALDPIDLRSVLAIFQLHRVIPFRGGSMNSGRWRDDSTQPPNTVMHHPDCLGLFSLSPGQAWMPTSHEPAHIPD